MHAAPGNPGIGEVATLHDVDPMDGAAVAALATSIGADLVVVGPEAPLVAGVADVVRDAGIAGFGPSLAAARLEGSKAFAKEVMATAGVPTAGSRTCTTPDEVAAALDDFGAPHVVKDDALAAGKGVVVTNDRDEALAHAAGCERVVVEEFLDGPEFSLFVVCDGSHRPAAAARPRTSSGSSTAAAAPTPAAWAPTRRSSGCPATWCRPSWRKVVDPTLAEMRRLEAPFVGCLYVGLALTAAGPKVIEFNVRFGDPDIQPVLALLDSPLGGLLAAAAVGNLADVPAPKFADGAAVSVVMASAGYPEGSSTGDVIVGTETLAVETDVDVIHAGTARTDDGPGHRRGPGARRARGRHRRRRRPREGVRRHLVDQLPGRPVAPRHRRRAARRRRGSGIAWLSRRSCRARTW